MGNCIEILENYVSLSDAKSSASNLGTNIRDYYAEM